MEGQRLGMACNEKTSSFAGRIFHVCQYWLDIALEEYQYYEEDPSRLDPIFDKLISERVEQWVAMADKRLKDQNVR
jgi:hypothetical protein